MANESQINRLPLPYMQKCQCSDNGQPISM